MKFLKATIFVFACFFELYAAEPKLRLVNVLFRHGDRTPTPNAMFPTDPNFNSKFFPYGIGALTNQGKQRMFKLGESLRERYNDYLGDVYLPDSLSARSTDSERTKMSLQLVLAGLYPPSEVQRWHERLDWQPVPFDYVDKARDDMLVTIRSPKYLMERQRVESKPDIRRRTADFSKFLAELSKLSGRPINSISLAKNIYDTLVAESSMNLTLPAWTTKMFPKGKLRDVALLDYDIVTYDDSITNALVGKLMSKVTKDLLRSSNSVSTAERKLFLYSVHDGNVAGILRSLKVYKTHVPEYSSAVVIELLEENGEHFVKVLYYQGIPSEFVELQMPRCPVLCPLQQYLNIINEVLSADSNEV